VQANTCVARSIEKTHKANPRYIMRNGFT